MIEDDPIPGPLRKQPSLEQQIETASIEDLEARIVRLRAEIAQCERAIASKRAQRAAADSVFGPRTS